MDYEIFKNVICERIMDFLPPIYGEMEPAIQEVTKVNEVKDALVLRPAKDGPAVAMPMIYLDDMYETGSEIPLFQILKPNIVNNVDLENPMGISVYANAIDCLKEIDTTFNALNVEIDTGRRMEFLSQEMFMIDKDGIIHDTHLGAMSEKQLESYINELLGG